MPKKMTPDELLAFTKQALRRSAKAHEQAALADAEFRKAKLALDKANQAVSAIEAEITPIIDANRGSFPVGKDGLPGKVIRTDAGELRYSDNAYPLYPGEKPDGTGERDDAEVLRRLKAARDGATCIKKPEPVETVNYAALQHNAALLEAIDIKKVERFSITLKPIASPTSEAARTQLSMNGR
jgi:hypothetical protein